MTKKLTAKEILMNAEINFKNYQKMTCGTSINPFFVIAMEQLRNGLKKLEAEDE